LAQVSMVGRVLVPLLYSDFSQDPAGRRPDEEENVSPKVCAQAAFTGLFSASFISRTMMVEH
jgi:hypothetical protein